MYGLPSMSDPDAIYDDAVVSCIVVKQMGNGDVRVEGDLHFKKYALDVLTAARAAVIRHHERPQIFPPIAPHVFGENEVAAEIQIKCRRNGSMSTGGAINDKASALRMIDLASDAVRDYYRKIEGGEAAAIPAKDTGLLNGKLLS